MISLKGVSSVLWTKAGKIDIASNYLHQYHKIYHQTSAGVTNRSAQKMHLTYLLWFDPLKFCIFDSTGLVLTLS